MRRRLPRDKFERNPYSHLIIPSHAVESRTTEHRGIIGEALVFDPKEATEVPWDRCMMCDWPLSNGEGAPICDVCMAGKGDQWEDPPERKRISSMVLDHSSTSDIATFRAQIDGKPFEISTGRGSKTYRDVADAMQRFRGQDEDGFIAFLEEAKRRATPAVGMLLQKREVKQDADFVRFGQPIFYDAQKWGSDGISGI